MLGHAHSSFNRSTWIQVDGRFSQIARRPMVPPKHPPEDVHSGVSEAAGGERTR
jgi:hypothetical protein